MNELLRKKQEREVKILELYEEAKDTPAQLLLRELVEIYEKEIYLYTMYGLDDFKNRLLNDEYGMLSTVVNSEGDTIRDSILNKISN